MREPRDRRSPGRKRSFPRGAGHALEGHIPGHKIEQSAGEAWADVEMQIFRRRQTENDILVPAVAEPLLVWVVGGEAMVEERELQGDWQGGVVRPGSFFLTQAEAPYLMRWKAKGEQGFEVVHLYLGLDLVGRCALSLGMDPARLRMRDVSGADDGFVSGVMAGLIQELRAAPGANRLFVQGLVESLTIHLLRRHAEARAGSRRRPAQLSTWKLRKALDDMEAHLAEPFDLDRLAALCGMSRFHFSRAFRGTMGHSPSRWLILRRIEHAKTMLRETDRQMIEIAARIGYDSPSHFAKVFREETGLTPRAFRGL
ncbi:helix-turn-helix transcriptional regulator [Acetobacteraceae bacterium H6797]|nr:helix-turn-helix transcriptional regulator [Acetobacteraceae bacterium H6797]